VMVTFSNETVCGDFCTGYCHVYVYCICMCMCTACVCVHVYNMLYWYVCWKLESSLN